MENILKNDLKKVAFHEAGHLLLLRHFGGSGDINIKPTYTKNIRFNRGFVGHVRVLDNIYEPKQKALMGISGYISELLLQGLDIIDAMDMWEINYDELSETDKELTRNMTDELFCEAFMLVKQLWPQIEKEALSEIKIYSQEYKQYLN